MTYKEWILQFSKNDSPIGDLARDIAQDSDFPQDNDYETLNNYFTIIMNESWRPVFNESWRDFVKACQ